MSRLSIEPSERASALLRAASVTGGVVALAGTLVLIGWTARIEVLKRIFVPGNFIVLPNTAVAFLLAGCALALLAQSRAHPWARSPARVLAGIVFLIGFAMFLQRAGGWDFAVTRWLFGETLASYRYRPIGLIAVNSAASFAMIGVALLETEVGTRRAQRVADTLGALALLVAITALVGYFYGVEALYSLDEYAGMALPTALTLAVLASGTLIAGVDHGVARLLLGYDAGAVLARRLLPPAILVPLGLGWMWLKAQQNAWIGHETGVSIFVVMTGSIFVVLVLRYALIVRRTDVDRERARRDSELARRAAEEARQRAEEAQQAAEAANVAKSEFLAMMSHELRTPLNAIRGYTELLDMGVRGPVTEAQRADLARIRQSERHLLGLIDDLLNFTRIERGELTYALRPVAAANAVEEVGSLIAPQMRARPIVYEPARVDPSVFVYVDPDRLQQILLNLLSNAVKFSEPGGRVSVDVDADDETVRISVADNGRGIPSTMLDTIFDPFVQVDAGHTRKTSGVGLGLAISRQLARAMDGDLTVESELGVGSRFILRLPRLHGADIGVAPTTVRRSSGKTAAVTATSE